MATGTGPLDLTAERREAVLRIVGTQAALEASEGKPFLFVETQWPGLLLDDFQRDMLSSIFDPTIREVYVKGNTSCGKGSALAIAVCVYFAVFPQSKVVITSASYHHAQSVIFAEVLKWWRLMRFPPAGKLLTGGIYDGVQHYVDVVNPDSDEAFSGRHGRSTFFVFDEATAIHDARYKLADTQATKFVAVANPRTLAGAFRSAFPVSSIDETQTIVAPLGRRRCITVDGADCLNVRERRLENPVGPIGGIEIEGKRYEHGDPISEDAYDFVRPLIPGQVCFDTWQAIVNDSSEFVVEVFGHGRFPTEDPETQLIKPSWLPRHVAAWQPDGVVEGFGLDVAASLSGDQTVLVAGSADGVAAMHGRREADTMATVGWAIALVRERYGIELIEGEVPIAVDMDGLGKGVGDRLAEQGCRVVEIRGNATPIEDRHRCANRRAEMYAHLADRLDPAQNDDAFALPDDRELLDELVAPEKVWHGSDGLKFRLTPKTRRPGQTFKGRTVSERLGRSPDKADAVAYMFQAVRQPLGTLSSWMEAGAF
jgi:hypothetical protein